MTAMELRTSLAGTLLRAERIRQRKGQKEICYGICVPSYLSKIEHGSVCPDEKILSALFARLGIRYESDPETLRGYGERIREYFYRLEYELDKRAVYEELKNVDEVLRYSCHAVDWLLIRAFEEEAGIDFLAKLKEQMTGRQLGWYEILRFWENPESKEGYRACRRACELLGNSFAMVSFCSACILQGDYASIHRMENRAVAVAVEEGNTYNLASYFFMKGNAYACLDLEEMMMDCYQKGIRLLQNTGWRYRLPSIYYNIGAAYIGRRKYDQAVEWLNRTLESCQKDASPEKSKANTMDSLITGTLHKKALALARSKRTAQAREILEVVKERLLSEGPCAETDYLKWKEACMECEEHFLEKEEYFGLLERLITALRRDCHFGHLYFYRDVVEESYIRRRQYKKAMEFEKELSSKIIS